MLVGAILLAACAPASTPSPVVVKQTVEVQETVQVPVTPTPMPTLTPKRGGTLIAAWATDAQGIDPQKATNFDAFRLIELTYDTLTAVDKDLNVIPDLGQSWEWSSDGLTLTMHLQHNVKFHSGNPLTSADVKFTFERIQDPKTAAANSSYFTSISSIDTPDPYTVVFHLSQPDVSILTAMTDPNSAIVDSKAVESGVDPGKTDVGSGPFTISNWTPNEELDLVANKNYWIQGEPYLDGIDFRTIPDEMSILAGLRAKQIDWAILTNPQVAIAAGSATSTIVMDRTPDINFHVLQLNLDRPYFKDVRVRQAISCALDRQQIIDTASLGEGQVIGPVTSPAYATPLTQLPCYTQDLNKAKELLAEAGYPNGKGLKFSILFTDDEMPTSGDEATNVSAQLQKIGIQTTLDQTELGVFVDRWFKVDFDMCVTQNGGYPDPDVELYRWWYSTGNLQSVTKYSTPEIDAELTAAREMTDFQKRKAIYGQISQQLVTASPWVWTYVGYLYRVMQPYVEGYIPLSTGSDMYLRQTWLNK
jgi:peptide/nickel transport system substrate-binding protein